MIEWVVIGTFILISLILIRSFCEPPTLKAKDTAVLGTPTASNHMAPIIDQKLWNDIGILEKRVFLKADQVCKQADEMTGTCNNGVCHDSSPAGKMKEIIHKMEEVQRISEEEDV